MKVVIIGGEKIAYFLAKSFSSKGYKTYLVNKDQKLCEDFARDLKAVVIHGDATKKKLLEQLDIEEEDIIVVLTNKDKENLIITQFAKKIFGVKNIVTLVNNPDNIELFEKLGITAVVSTTTMLQKAVENLLFGKELEEFLAIEEGKLSFLKVDIPENSQAIGKFLKNLNLPHECVVGGILRKGEVIIPHGNTQIKAGDRLYIVSLPTAQTEILKILTEE
ncbi:potassium transporter TrkA [Thermosipho melanesiensis]|uniref:TrkA-N domain protein n=2 Tax=Thermosipho melanesiensis TaxID=46541 RepID=A6LMF9_THEM4|nr:NAD-binding protein [Thermosipho melanesiensis]ABR31110.1 TrkA-N domain protein [Thermosipho melanesiensis BI429]APT74201.1 potassium transporter TrkA [Thermosipho melanesiensis]OOC36148.1 potassium transporter TrkA [Thermosipho melanesiensis]OOC36965.1 potassium transporter TrkA [Thermosipho melanesiensis]OOC37717.1 potassium transporter TrkA [Thermosipho melanesiensis]